MIPLSSGITCFIVCFGHIPASKPIPAPDTFCSVYRRQVLTNEDLNSISALPRTLRDRMQANDLYYMCKCRNWSAPECRKLK